MDSFEMNNEPPEAPASAPTEPFPCPECGQMLAASCRVCVACKAPVDYSRIDKNLESKQPEVPAPAPQPPVEPARFSWGIFFTVLLVYFFVAFLSQALVGLKGSTYVMGGFVLATSLWVFFDARAKGIPKPAGWTIGCLLLWIVLFPWYLSRRRTPEAICPLIEGESGPLARAIILFLILLTLVSFAIMFFSGDRPLS